MPAPIKNQFWKARTKHGRDKIFSNPEILMQAACEFFNWCDANPLKEVKVFGTGKSAMVNLVRAYTMKHLYLFLDINRITWDRYKADKDFIEIMTKIEDIVYTQKFTNAAVGLLNANIISRDLGLKDANDITTGGESLNNGFSALVSRINKNRKDKSND